VHARTPLNIFDIEPVAQQMREAPDPEGNASNDAAVPQLALLGSDAAALKVSPFTEPSAR
jgi:hypothetical protein